MKLISSSLNRFEKCAIYLRCTNQQLYILFNLSITKPLEIFSRWDHFLRLMGTSIGKYAIPKARLEMRRAHIKMQGISFKMRHVGELLALEAAG
jgi:hypothetical protein